ncbi:MAG: histidine-type phosphatase [Lachnospiraceae bacterium]|nr:histidine-type phosphatase [Lachnospiraceae bacterium]
MTNYNDTGLTKRVDGIIVSSEENEVKNIKHRKYLGLGIILSISVLLTACYGADININVNRNAFGGKETDENTLTSLSREGYTLEQAVVLSRHNIRAPFSGEGSVLDALTPNKWFEWSAGASQLSTRGGILETEMGQYFRKWLEAEGLFEPNYRPADGTVRIYANSLQRTIATAKFFSAGLLPVAGTWVEYHMDFDTMDPVFDPVLTYVSEDYAADAEDEIKLIYGDTIVDLANNLDLISEVIDVRDSDAFKKGKFAGFNVDDYEFYFEEGEAPSVQGSLFTACLISDALVLQYYEEPDPTRAAFGHDLSEADWEAISEVKDVYCDILFTAPSVAVNVAHPLLEEIEKELLTEGRQFTFLCGHDSSLASVLSALEVQDYSLPGTIEKKTPIGGKLVISKWKDKDGKAFISLDMVYQKTQQLQQISLLNDENPPGIYNLKLRGINADANGLYKAEDVMERFEKAIEAYDSLVEEYEAEDAAQH